MLDRIVKKIYELQAIPEYFDKELTEFYAETFWKTVTKNFGEDLFSVSYDTPDYLMLRSLQENVYQFAAAKDYQQLKQLSEALTDDAGSLRTFSEFKEVAAEINSEFSIRYMKAEYEMAVASAQMAAKWTRIQETKEVLPLLQFDAVMDERTTPVCQSLDGVVRPVDDSFWDIYYPPNHWGCRSDVRSLADGTETPDADIVFPDNMPDIFKTNLAKSGLIFPEDHPYFNGLPD